MLVLAKIYALLAKTIRYPYIQLFYTELGIDSRTFFLFQLTTHNSNEEEFQKGVLRISRTTYQILTMMIFFCLGQL